MDNYGSLVFAIIFVIIGIPSNLTILFVSFFDKKKSPTQFFMNNIAFAEILWLLCLIFKIHTRRNGRIWIFGEMLCFLHESIEVFICVLNIMMIMIMAIYRYSAITMKKCLFPNKSPWIPTIFIWVRVWYAVLHFKTSLISLKFRPLK